MGAVSRTTECTIKNKLGLHARPASLFVQTANGKSLMSMLVLSAACGSKLTITACGHDAEDALKALNDLVDRRFDEE